LELLKTKEFFIGLTREKMDLHEIIQLDFQKRKSSLAQAIDEKP